MSVVCSLQHEHTRYIQEVRKFIQLMGPTRFPQWSRDQENICLVVRNFGCRFLAGPGKARGCSTNTFVIQSVTESGILFLSQLYAAAIPKRIKSSLPVIYHRDEELSKSWRPSKLHKFFKSYGNFTEGRILPLGGVASVRVCAWSLHSRLVRVTSDRIYK